MADLHEVASDGSLDEESRAISRDQPETSNRVSNGAASSDSTIVKKCWDGCFQSLREFNFDKLSEILSRCREPGTLNSDKSDREPRDSDLILIVGEEFYGLEPITTLGKYRAQKKLYETRGYQKNLGKSSEIDMGPSKVGQNVNKFVDSHVGSGRNVNKSAAKDTDIENIGKHVMKSSVVDCDDNFGESSKFGKRAIKSKDDGNSESETSRFGDYVKNMSGSRNVRRNVKKSTVHEMREDNLTKCGIVTANDIPEESSVSSEDLENLSSNSFDEMSNLGSDSDLGSVEVKKKRKEKRKYKKAGCSGKKSTENSSGSSKNSTTNYSSEDEMSIITSKYNTNRVSGIPNVRVAGPSKVVENNSQLYNSNRIKPSKIYSKNLLKSPNDVSAESSKYNKKNVVRYCKNFRGPYKESEIKNNSDDDFDEDVSLLSNIRESIDVTPHNVHISRPSINVVKNSTKLSPKPGCSKDTENRNLSLSWEDIMECNKIVESQENEIIESSQKPVKFSSASEEKSWNNHVDEISCENSSTDYSSDEESNFIVSLDEVLASAEPKNCNSTVGQEFSMISDDNNASQYCSSDRNASQYCSSDENTSQICSSQFHKRGNISVYKELSEHSQAPLKFVTKNRCEAEHEVRSVSSSHVNTTTQNDKRITSNSLTSQNENMKTSNYPKTQYENKTYEKAKTFSSEYEKPNRFPPVKRKIATISSTENASNVSKIRKLAVPNCSSGNTPTSFNKNCSKSGNFVAASSISTSARGNVARASKNVSTIDYFAPLFRKFSNTVNTENNSENVKCKNKSGPISFRRKRFILFVGEKKYRVMSKLPSEKQSQVVDVILKTQNLSSTRRKGSTCRSLPVDDNINRVSVEGSSQSLQSTTNFRQNTSLPTSSGGNSNSQSLEDNINSVPVGSLSQIIPSKFRNFRQQTYSTSNAVKPLSQDSGRLNTVTRNRPSQYKTLEDVLERYPNTFSSDQTEFRFSYRMKRFLGLNPYGSSVLYRRRHETRTDNSSHSTERCKSNTNNSSSSNQNSEPVRNSTTAQKTDTDDRGSRCVFENRSHCNSRGENFFENSETVRKNTRYLQHTVRIPDEFLSSRTSFETESNSNNPRVKMESDENYDVNVQSLSSYTSDVNDNFDVKVENSSNESMDAYENNDINLQSSTENSIPNSMSATATVKSEENDEQNGNISIKQEIITVSDDSQSSFSNLTQSTMSSAENSSKIASSHKNAKLENRQSYEQQFYRMKNCRNPSSTQNNQQMKQITTTKRKSELEPESGSAKYNLQIKQEIITISDDDDDDGENDYSGNATSNHNQPISQGSDSESQSSLSEHLHYVHPSSQLNSSRPVDDCVSRKNREFLQSVGTDKSLQERIVGIKQVIDSDGWLKVDMRQVERPRVRKCSCFYRDTYMIPYIEVEPCVNCAIGDDNLKAHEEYVNKFMMTNRPFVAMSLEEVSCSRNLDDWAHTNVKVTGQLRMRGMTEANPNGPPPYMCREVDHDFYLQSIDEPGGPYNVCIDFEHVKRAMPVAGKQIEACAELSVISSVTSSYGEPFLKAILYRDLDTVDRSTLKAYSRALDMRQCFVPLFMKSERAANTLVNDSCLDEEFDANKPRLL